MVNIPRGDAKSGKSSGKIRIVEYITPKARDGVLFVLPILHACYSEIAFLYDCNFLWIFLRILCMAA